MKQLPRIMQFALLAGISVIAVAVTHTGHAAAASYCGTGYFTGTTRCTQDPVSISQNDVIGPRNAVPSYLYDGTNDQKDIYDWLAGQIRLNGAPTTRNEWGASFIVNTMLNTRSSVVTSAMMSDLYNRLVANPNIRVSSTTDSPNNYGNGLVSFYDNGDDFFADNPKYPSGSRGLLIIEDLASNTKYILEIPCANPVGGLHLDAYNPNTPPKGNLDSMSCTNIAGWAFDPDSSTTAIHYRIYVNGNLAVDRATDVQRNDVNGAYGISGVHGFSDAPSSIPSFNVRTVNTVEVRAVDAQTGGEYTIGSPVNIGPCVKATCMPSTLPSSAPVGSTVTFKVSFNIGASYAPPYSTSPWNPAVTVKVTDANGNIVPTNYAYPTPVPYYAGYPPGAVIQTNDISFTPTSAGQYHASWYLRGGSPNNLNIDCGADGTPPTGGSTIDVSLEPFFNVTGDITAGAGYGTGGCSVPTTPANIKSWNLNGSPNYNGAGSTAGAWASGTITNFVSGLGLSGGAASQAGKGVSFANGGTGVNVSSGNYGGSFDTGTAAGSTNMPCNIDYAGTLPSTGVSNVPGLNFNSAPLPNTTPGIYNFKRSGDLAINGLKLAAGQTVTVYVTGDVYISGNITYAPYSLANIPRFNLYATGNITINEGVSELHGVYVAQQDPANKSGTGHITTCVLNTVATTETYAGCNSPLVVYGAVSAENSIYMTRTYGNVIAAPGAPYAPAEQFIATPELWLHSSNGATSDVQSYTGLPPVL